MAADDYGCALHAGLVRIHARKHTLAPVHSTYTHTHTNMYYLLLFHYNSGFVNAPQCYVIRMLPVLFILLKCSECFECYVICCLLYPLANFIALS